MPSGEMQRIKAFAALSPCSQWRQQWEVSAGLVRTSGFYIVLLERSQNGVGALRPACFTVQSIAQCPAVQATFVI